MPFNSLTDLVPITRVALVNMAFIVDGSLPVSNMKEFVALMKANPGKYNYGSAGAGGTTHVQFDAFARQAGFQMTHIAYNGIAPAMKSGSISTASASTTGPISSPPRR